jgi:hypothetical protein
MPGEAERDEEAAKEVKAPEFEPKVMTNYIR